MLDGTIGTDADTLALRSTGVWPKAVPVLAPWMALALSLGLLAAGARVLRRGG